MSNAGRRPKARSAEDRAADLRKSIQKSGFAASEVFQILVDWYGYREIVLYCGTLGFEITNSEITKTLPGAAFRV